MSAKGGQIERRGDRQHRLAMYALAGGSALAVTASADAGIVYVDIPDVVLGPGNGDFDLDMNSDGTVDFVFSFRNTPYTYGEFNGIYLANASATGGVAGFENVGYFYPYALAQGDVIGPGNVVDNPGLGTLAFNYVYQGSTYNLYGEWVYGVKDGYVGLRFNVGGKDYFGWARLDVEADTLITTIKDFAYNSMPSQRILAGQTTSVVPEPSSLGLLALGAIGVLAHRRLRKGATELAAGAAETA